MSIFQLSLEASFLHKLRFYRHLRNIIHLKIYLMVYLKRRTFSRISIKPRFCYFQYWHTLSSWSSSFSWQDSVITLEMRHSEACLQLRAGLCPVQQLVVLSSFLQIVFTGLLRIEMNKLQSLGTYPHNVTVTMSCSWGTGEGHSSWHTQPLQPKGAQPFLHLLLSQKACCLHLVPTPV